jgi:hypothetical protein
MKSFLLIVVPAVAGLALTAHLHSQAPAAPENTT